MANLYKCILTDKNGKIKTITKEGNSPSDIINSFANSEFIPLDIIQLKSKQNKYTHKKNSKLVLEFTQIMDQLITSGLSIKDALEVSSTINTSHKNKNDISAMILEKIKKGISFAEAINEMDFVFPSVYRGIISVGDKIGSIEKIFPRLKLYLETKKKIKDKISSALLYPLIVLSTALCVFIGMLVFVFPKLKNMFIDFGGDAATILEKNITNIEKGFVTFFLILSLLFISILILVLIAKKDSSLKERLSKFLLKLPILGKYFTYLESLNFTFAMETLISGGISVEDAIQESVTVLSNFAYKTALLDIKNRITQGESLSYAFSVHHDIFPEYMIKWMLVGEKSGKPEFVFSQLRTYFQTEIDLITSKFMNLIEPILIIFIGIVLIILIVNIIVPMFSLYGSIL